MQQTPIFERKNVLVTGGAGFTPHHPLARAALFS